MAEGKTPRSYNAPALERGFDILELLASGTPSLTISEIAYRAGFNDLSTFNREFRRHFGATPSEFRAWART